MAVTAVVSSHQKCFHCHKEPPKLKACARCKQAFYCNVECQTAHWQSTHKAICKPVAVDPHNATTKKTAMAAAEVLDHKDDGKEMAQSIQELSQSWLDQLQPVSCKNMQKARKHALELFAEIVLMRKRTMDHPNDKTKWGGLFYAHEVCPTFKTGRVPLELQNLYTTAFVDKTHRKLFDHKKRKFEFPDDVALRKYLNCLNDGSPTIVDSGAVASLFQLWVYDLFFPEDAIYGAFFGYPPRNMWELAFMMRTIHQAKKNLTPLDAEFHTHRPKQVDWGTLKREFSQIDVKPLDLCYITNDPRYEDYPASSKGSAFKSASYQGASQGWWITYVGKNHEGEDLYIGFGVDEGPMTLDKWKELLRKDFITKWGEIPEDWNCKTGFYHSPFRVKWRADGA